jgi:antitoxin HicB
MDYDIVISKLDDEDGYAAYAPDLPGCLSDGDTHEEALENCKLAILEWIDEANNRGMVIPKPGDAAKFAHEAREELFRELRAVVEWQDAIHDRQESLDKKMEEIHERLDNIDAWRRFDLITNREEITEHRLLLTGGRMHS